MALSMRRGNGKWRDSFDCDERLTASLPGFRNLSR